MTFKNAFKILLSSFRYVWDVLVYLLILLALIMSVSLPVLGALYRELAVAGTLDALAEALYGFLSGQTIAATYERVVAILSDAKRIFDANGSNIIVSTYVFSAITFVVFRFLFGLHEIPMLRVTEGIMSDNARYGFAGRFVSAFGKSALYSLAKTLVSVLCTALALVMVLPLVKLLGSISFLFVPIGFTGAILVLKTIKHTFISAWGPKYTVEDCGVFASLGYSIRFGAKHFGPMASTYFIAWVLILTVNFLVAVFTFLFGLLITIPASVLFMNVLNMTFYYSRNDKSYYLDGKVVLQSHSEKDGTVKE
ncbi:MAG: hypothetical protein ACLUSP_06645 [Christensenellales bacterium]